MRAMFQTKMWMNRKSSRSPTYPKNKGAYQCRADQIKTFSGEDAKGVDALRDVAGEIWSKHFVFPWFVRFTQEFKFRKCPTILRPEAVKWLNWTENIWKISNNKRDSTKRCCIPKRWCIPQILSSNMSTIRFLTEEEFWRKDVKGQLLRMPLSILWAW